jgi:hypothetical protein
MFSTSILRFRPKATTWLRGGIYRSSSEKRSGYQSLLPEEQSKYRATGYDGSGIQVSGSEDINLEPPRYNILLCPGTLGTDGWIFAFVGMGNTMIQHPPRVAMF